jgi:hypothetical protein
MMITLERAHEQKLATLPHHSRLRVRMMRCYGNDAREYGGLNYA